MNSPDQPGPSEQNPAPQPAPAPQWASPTQAPADQGWQQPGAAPGPQMYVMGEQPVPGMPVEPPRPAGGNRNRALLLTGLAGLVAGAILVGGVWVGTSLGVPGTENAAARDADAACGIIGRLPDMTEDSLTRPHANRAAGAAALAAAAAEDDARYSELSEAASGMLQAIQVYNLDLINNRLVAARAACDDL
jgi:hypothetical protein